MQFVVIAYDGKDDKAFERRLAAREEHVALGNRMRDAGQMLYGVAILDDSGKMIGSVMICEFASKAELDQWLKIEPYVTADVWQEIEIKPCRVGPSFAGVK